MRLSVIVPTLHEQETVPAAVRSAFAAGADEVVVADGGSRDGTRRAAAEAGAIVVSGPSGRGSQLNRGAAAASGDVLLFLHADNRLPATARAQVEKALGRSGVVHGAFRQRIEAPGLGYRWIEFGNARRVAWLGMPYGDQGLFVQRESFERVGGFPNDPLMEDVGIARRLRRFGRPALCEGPLTVSARRWREEGLLRRTLKNWLLVTAWSAGVSPKRLQRWYRPAKSGRPGPPSVATDLSE